MPTALYLAAAPAAFRDLCETARRQPDIVVAQTARGAHLVGDGMVLDLELVTELEVAVDRIRATHYPLIIVDCRNIEVEGSAAEQVLLALLERRLAERDRERRFRLDRLIVLVGDGDEARVDRFLFELGQRRVGAFVRDRSSTAIGSDQTAVARATFFGDLWHRCRTALAPRRSRKALCAAGGGITGVYYELGVLKCLHDAFGEFDVRDFDMYYGISAGAIVTSLIANGIGVDEVIRDVDPLTRGRFDLEIDVRDLTVADLPRRLMAVLRHLESYGARVMAGQEKLSITGAASQLAALIGPFFHTAPKERRLREVLTQAPHTNDFRCLPRELYIGATDQDSREHVLFGEEPFRDVPIGKAVQASTAIHPFFKSVEIDGRYYTDGFVTRTSNVTSAIERGANLVFVIDPFLPLIADEPGFNSLHSVFWVVVQDYKTVAYTRYEQVSRTVLEQHPEVVCHSFFPSNRMRRLMASNPISIANFDAIVTEAYASTYRRLRRIEYKLGPELAVHGISLDLSPVARKVKLIKAMIAPRASVLYE